METDKAVYPIEASFAGTMGEWKTEVDATVDIGQDIGTVIGSGDEVTEQLADAVDGIVDPVPPKTESKSRPDEHSAEVRAIEPALTPTITRRLGRVVPANLQIDARWTAISEARAALKKSEGKAAASPSVMLAWAVVRAMEKHAPFRRVMLEHDSIVEHAEFDLGIAVSLENDRLATAVVTKANTRDWPLR